MKLYSDKEINGATVAGWFVVVVVLIFLARSIYTSHPELGGDAMKKWKTAVVLAETGNTDVLFEYAHHSIRWGVVLPTALANKLFGTSLFNYYLVPLVFYAFVFAVLLYFAAQSLSLGWLGVFGVVLFYDPYFFRATSQLQPFIFGVGFITGSLFVLYHYLKEKNLGYLIGAAFLAFLAYGAKETYVFFFPGLFAFLWLYDRFRTAILFGVLLMAFLIAETLVINYLSGYLTLGRMEFLSGGPHVLEMEKKYLGFSYLDLLTTRWLLIPNYNKVLAIFSVIGGLFVIRNYRTVPPCAVGVFLLAVSYSLFVSAVPISLNPLLPLQPLRPKYLIPVMPFLAFGCVYGLHQMSLKLPNLLRSGMGWLVNGVAVVFLLVCLIWDSPFTSKHRANVYPRMHNMVWRVEDVNADFTNGYGVCVDDFFDKIQVHEFFRDFYFPPWPDAELGGSKISRGDGTFYRVVHKKGLNAEDLTGFYHVADMKRVENVAECPWR
jgi:hypothetical protein